MLDLPPVRCPILKSLGFCGFRVGTRSGISSGCRIMIVRKEAGMSRLAPFLFFILLPFSALSCGTDSTRQLQSITLSSTKSGQAIEFVATGTFSAPPTTVTPLAVDWTLGLMAPPPKQYTYTLTTQPYVFNCANAGAYN